MRLYRVVMLLAVLLPLSLEAQPATATVPSPAPRTLWTAWAGATVYNAPTATAATLTIVPGNQPLRVTPDGPGWARTVLWGAQLGWVPLASLRARPYVPPVTHWRARGAPASLHAAGAHAPIPLAATARLSEAVYLRAAPALSAAHVALLRRGVSLVIDAWATDRHGGAWYHITTAGGGWLYGPAVTMDAGLPANRQSLLTPLRGKGMWLTYPLLQHTPVAVIVHAAKAAGLTHLYVEVGRSNSGFYGAGGLGALLPAAHRAGLRVIAWVYPFLLDLPLDVAIGAAAARYVAPTGDRPDGLLADVEENVDPAMVRAYGQVLRAMLGPNELMAAATFPPQSAPGKTYPFAQLAMTWNAIVPMDYWRLRRRAYTAANGYPADAYTYVSDSVRLIHERAGVSIPVEVLGQMFDPYQSGVNSPGAAEIAACFRAAHDAGAIGVSFFEWNHATPEEWGALSTNAW